jgi:hypothetical protein
MKIMSAAAIPEKSFVLMNATSRFIPSAMVLAFLKSLKVRSSDLLAMKTFLFFAAKVEATARQSSVLPYPVSNYM